MGSVEDFIRANRDLMALLGKLGGLEDVIRGIEYRRGWLTARFRAALFTANNQFSNYDPSLGRALANSSPLGLHAFMFHDLNLAIRARNAPIDNHERMLADYFRESVDALRECMVSIFESWVSFKEAGRWDDVCEWYRGTGAVILHLGRILAANPGIEGSPRGVVINRLVTWMLEVLNSIASGGEAAGSIAVMGSHIGSGKTTTLYYTIRSIASILGHSDPDYIASSLIFIDPEEFLYALEELVRRGEKAAIMVIDNASTLLPKYWYQVGGGMQQFYMKIHKSLNIIRSISAITIFVANGPEEIASFVRKMARLGISGAQLEIPTHIVTVFTWKGYGIRITEREEELTKRDRIASVYAYPLLKLPKHLYTYDLELKKEINKKVIAEAVKIYKEAVKNVKTKKARRGGS